MSAYRAFSAEQAAEAPAVLQCETPAKQNPQYDELYYRMSRKIFELQEKSDALDAAEIKRAIDAKELDYAAELLQKLGNE